jgi:hypothetical protein
METAFDLATREIEQGSALLDGGNAVWMNLGDGAGSAGARRYPTSGPVESPELRTVRLDWQLGEFTLSASRSKGTNAGGGDVEVDALGAIWRHEFDKTTLFVGAGYDKGPMDRFNSFSFGFTSGGLNVVINRIHRTPLVFNRTEPDFDTSYDGLSLSYDFGDVTLGMAHSSQKSNIGGVLTGKARAVFASWQVREDLVMDFEFSESDYLSGDDTRKASIAVAMEF